MGSSTNKLRASPYIGNVRFRLRGRVAAAACLCAILHERHDPLPGRCPAPGGRPPAHLCAEARRSFPGIASAYGARQWPQWARGAHPPRQAPPRVRGGYHMRRRPAAGTWTETCRQGARYWHAGHPWPLTSHLSTRVTAACKPESRRNLSFLKPTNLSAVQSQMRTVSARS